MDFKKFLEGFIKTQEQQYGRDFKREEKIKILTSLEARGKWNTTKIRGILHFGKSRFHPLKTASGSVLLRTLGPLCAVQGKTHKAKKREQAAIRSKFTWKQWREELAFIRREMFKEGRGIPNRKSWEARA